MKLTSALAAGAAAAAVTGGTAHADDGNAKDFLGSWNTVHSSPYGPFREFLSFADGGVLQETNTFLHTTSTLDFSAFNPQLTSLHASDGMGSWVRVGNGVVNIAFRKLLFNGSNQNVGDLYVTATMHSDGRTIFTNNAHIVVLSPSGALLADFGFATSQGVRIR